MRGLRCGNNMNLGDSILLFLYQKKEFQREMLFHSSTSENKL